MGVKLLKPTTQHKSPIQDNNNKSIVKQKNSYIQLMLKLNHQSSPSKPTRMNENTMSN
jgi:hypothetical protein